MIWKRLISSIGLLISKSEASALKSAYYGGGRLSLIGPVVCILCIFRTRSDSLLVEHATSITVYNTAGPPLSFGIFLQG